MEENVYKKARITASKKKHIAGISSAAVACHQLYISREKLLHIEQEDDEKVQEIPDPAEVIRMAELYDAPELLNYYCSCQCLIGEATKRKPLMHDSLSEISTLLMSAIHFMNNANDKIHLILKDSVISENEKSEFKRILTTLKEISYSVDSLELWAKKNDIIIE